MLAGLQIFVHPAAGLTFGKAVQCFAQVILGETMIFRDAEHGHHAEGGIAGGRVFGPADHGGIAEDTAMIPVGQQRVQCSGVSKGGIFADRGILTLLVPIGTKCRGVEGNERGSGALCAGNTLDGGMQPGGWGLLAGHETLDQRSVGRSAAVVLLPCRSDRFIFSGQDAALRPFIVEQKVGVSGDILPAVSQ